MASISANGSKGHHKFTLTVEEVSYDIASNTSYVHYTFVLSAIQSGWNWSSISNIKYTGNIGGNAFSGSISSYGGSGSKTLKDGYFTIPHETDGSKNLGFSFSVTDTSGKNYTPGNASSSGSTWLTQIPRYANITRFDISNVTETSVVINWNADANCDYAWYSKDNGANWSALAYPSMTVSGLTAGTNYNFKIRVRRADSQLTTDSNTIQKATYNYPYVTQAPNFIIGNTLTITISNPLSRSCDIYLKGVDGSEKFGGTITGTTISPFNNDEWVDFLYQSMIDSQSGTYKIRLVCSSVSRDTTVNGGTYSVNGNERPTFSNYTYNDINTTTVALSGSTEQNPIIIKGYSNIQATITTDNKAVPNDYATMSKYRLLIGDKSAEVSYSEDSNVSVTVEGATSKSIQLSAIDSRSLSTVVEKTNATLKEYFKPVVSSMTLSRSDGGVGENVYISFNGTWWNDNFGVQDNGIQHVYYYYKAQNQETYTQGSTIITATYNENTFRGSDIQIDGPVSGGLFAADLSYTIKIVVVDKLGTSDEYIATISSGTPGIAMYDNKVAIGQKYDTQLGGSLQINGVDLKDVYVGNKTMEELVALSLYPVGSLYLSTDSTSPASKYGGTWTQITGRYLYLDNSSGDAGSNNGSTGSTTLTAAQSGLRDHGHSASYTGANFYVRHGKNSGTATVAAGSYTSVETGVGAVWGNGFETANYSHAIDRVNIGGGVTVNNSGSLNATQGHTHTIDLLKYKMYAWVRTA